MRSLALPSRVASLFALLCIMPLAVGAQSVRTLTACTPDAIGVCADIRLTSSANFFEIGVRALGASGPLPQPVSVYNLVFATGAQAAGPTTTNVTPQALGGALVADASVWEVFDAGDALFLSALSNRGVGGCVTGADVDGFGQAATTCGPGQFITFGFTPTAAFDPFAFSIQNFETVVLSNPTQAATCGDPAVPCTITADVRETLPPPSTTVPEPTTVVLFGAGCIGLLVAARRRRV